MNYATDNITESDVLGELEGAGLRFRNGSRYILSQCPLHEDNHSSAQIYKDDWFVKCHAGCEGGRFHITKAFPNLRGTASGGHAPPTRARKPKAPEVKYKSIDLMDYWQTLPTIPRDHEFKTIPLDILDSLGWRWDAEHNRYFIPYFSRSKKSIPFAQWRNLSGNVRFNFWKDAKPTMYGTWNLEPGDKLFLCEGASDAAVLDYCMVPWIAAPSAASGELVKAMATWAAENDVQIVYAGDNDEAGDKLKDALSTVSSFRRKQPRSPYKDWGEMLEAEGATSVTNYCFQELFPDEEPVFDSKQEGVPIGDIEDSLPDTRTDLEKIQEVFPGAVQMEMVDKPRPTTEYVIRVPIWKGNAVGLNVDTIGYYNKVTISYETTDGVRLYPEPFWITGEKARTYPTKKANGNSGVNLYIIPIADLSKTKIVGEEKKQLETPPTLPF